MRTTVQVCSGSALFGVLDLPRVMVRWTLNEMERVKAQEGVLSCQASGGSFGLGRRLLERGGFGKKRVSKHAGRGPRAGREGMWAAVGKE